MTCDKISNPAHYTDGREYEPRKVIEDWELNFNLGNVIKYLARAGRKGDLHDHLDDLHKAKQYLEFEIERVSKKIAGYYNSEMLKAYEEFERREDGNEEV